MAEQRKDSRSATSLKVKYKSATVDDFAQQFGTDVSRGGIFIKTKSALEPGALLKLELQLSTSAAVISGIGRVAWRRSASQDPARPAGMGIKFIKLEPASQAIVERIVSERGAQPSRFDQNEGAELARASLEPPAPVSLAPARTSAPADAPITVRPPAPLEMPAAALPQKAPLAAKPIAAKPLAAKPLTPAPKPAPAPVASTPAAASLASSRPRIAPSKAAIPSGLFANSPLAQGASAPPAEEKRTSFFPPAPSAQASPRGGSTASGQLSSPRSSAGSVSSPLQRPNNSRTPSPIMSSRAPAAGPKGVFGGPGPTSPLANSTSGLLRPAKEISGLSSSSLRPDRSADEAPTAAVPRPASNRGAARSAEQSAGPAVAAPSVLESLVDDVFGDATPDGAEPNGDGMFATLEPLDAIAAPPPGRGSRPSNAGRASPAPQASAPARASTPRMQQGLGAAEAADVDNLFADLEGDDDARTDEVIRPSAASAVFSPGSTHPSLPPGLGNLADEEDFGEADLLGDARGIPPFDDDDDEDLNADDELAPAVAAASEPPMLRLAESGAPQTSAEPKRSPVRVIAIAVLAIAAVVAAIALAKPELLGLGASAPARPSVAAPATPSAVEPSAPAAATKVPAPSAPPTDNADLPAAELTSVNITSLPRGADVRVGNAVVGNTPTNIDLPIGRDTAVTVAAQGYAAQTKTVSATRGMDPLRFKLDPLPYVLVVMTTPAQAEVSVGSTTSISPAPLALGHISGGVDVAIAKEGYRRITRQVRLEEFSEQDGVLRAEIEVTLSPMPGEETAPAAAASPSPSSRRHARGSSRTPDAPLAPPEPDVEPAAPAAPAAPVEQQAAPAAPAEPQAAPEPAKEPGAPPPPPALPTLP